MAALEAKPTNVLFVCGQNAARSQMAAALFKQHAGPGVVVNSAGISAASELSPTAVQVLDEVGVHLTGVPKTITVEMVDVADVIVAVGCGIHHDAFKGNAKKVRDWTVSDPKGQPIDNVREIRNEIDSLATTLSRELR